MRSEQLVELRHLLRREQVAIPFDVEKKPFDVWEKQKIWTELRVSIPLGAFHGGLGPSARKRQAAPRLGARALRRPQVSVLLKSLQYLESLNWRQVAEAVRQALKQLHNHGDDFAIDAPNVFERGFFQAVLDPEGSRRHLQRTVASTDGCSVCACRWRCGAFTVRLRKRARR